MAKPSHQVLVRLSKDEKAAVEYEAARRKKHRSDIMRDLIERGGLGELVRADQERRAG